jgi:hypothetical protein
MFANYTRCSKIWLRSSISLLSPSSPARPDPRFPPGMAKLPLSRVPDIDRRVALRHRPRQFKIQNPKCQPASFRKPCHVVKRKFVLEFRPGLLSGNALRSQPATCRIGFVFAWSPHAVPAIVGSPPRPQTPHTSQSARRRLRPPTWGAGPTNPPVFSQLDHGREVRGSDGTQVLQPRA